jgi:hypothetical protein
LFGCATAVPCTRKNLRADNNSDPANNTGNNMWLWRATFASSQNSIPLVAAIPTSSPRSRQRTLELSRAGFANAQRRHAPQRWLLKRTCLRANRKAPIAPFKTVARTASALKSRHFFAVMPIHKSGRAAEH